jgi:type I restriction enzyme R subunit
LSRENLLDILHSYIVFATDDKGRVIKLAPRYQQYRTARKILARLKTKDTPKEKSGIVWHTQGSGKLLTMMFTARAACHDPALSK